MEALKKLAQSLALENAIKFKGKVNAGAVMGPLFKLYPGFNPKEHSQIVNEIIAQVNSLSLEEQEKLFSTLGTVKEDKPKHSGELPPLKNAEIGKVVTRIPPGPSKYAHVGHAISFLINYLYAREYQGKCILRFDDTNPDVDRQEYVDEMTKDLTEYLKLEPDKIIYASDDMEKFIGFADKLIEDGNAYTCNCPSEVTSLNRREEKECEHRNQDIETVKLSFESMKSGKLTDTILRLKIDMSHKNAVMRDPAIYRVITTPHYRQKDRYKVWPLYDFESAIEDGSNGVTHVLRSNEFDSRIELHNHIAALFGFGHVEYKHYGRSSVGGAVTQGREIKKLIESGNYLGWDDPRLVTLKALARRGIVKETLIELTKKAGLSKNQTNIDFTVLSSINRSILDKTSKRFYFIEKAKELEIENSPQQVVELDLHPDNLKGGRVFNTNSKFLIEEKDYKSGEEIRLIDCLNFKDDKFVSISYKDFKGKKKIHWLPNDKSQLLDVEILMPDLEIKKGLAEKAIEILKIGDVIQFERFGFCRLDSIDENTKTYKFWYTHD